MIVPVLWPELPGVLVSPFDIIDANIPQNFLQVNLESKQVKEIKNILSVEFVFLLRTDGAWLLPQAVW